MQRPKLASDGQQVDQPGMGLEFEVRNTRAGGMAEGFISELVPEVAEQFAWGELLSRQAVEDEIDLMLRAIRGFWDLEPDQVMQMSSALSARCTEMAIHLHRLEGKREWRQVRTQQVERLLAELDRQFRIASRLLEVRRQDIETSR